ncbi:MAG TPA: phosphate acyltransferase PlsX [Verrucomicrobiae bacterium]|nr:phosphate acyltransferase PlsX [Verrucomicrobiae bacterium]
MRIVVDVMGGDHGCVVVIEGVKRALEADQKISALHLVGKEDEIQSALKATGLRDGRIRIVHASEVMTMEDKPTVALRKKKDSSMARAIELVADGKADAVISLGNTGGILALSTLRLRPLEGVDRAGIAAVIPAPDNDFILLDAGANIECKPVHLMQYAVMGSVYSRAILGYEKPRVGLLSNGTEEGKGTELTKEAYKLCKQIDINFVGNIEGHGLFANQADVVICDGFVGNIVLKTCESLALGMVTMLKRELSRNPKRQLGAYLAQNALRAIKRRMDPEAYGGAPLLGLNGTVMKAHGSAREKAIMNAIRITTETIQHQITQVISNEIQRANERLDKQGSEPTTTGAL